MLIREYNEMNKEMKNIWNLCGIHYINMIDISRRVYERNGIKAIVDNDEILW